MDRKTRNMAVNFSQSVGTSQTSPGNSFRHLRCLQSSLELSGFSAKICDYYHYNTQYWFENCTSILLLIPCVAEHRGVLLCCLFSLYHSCLSL